MVRLPSVAIVLCSFGLVAGSAGAEDTDTTAVRGVFERYKAALLTGDGATAVALVDIETLDYYGEIHGLALEGDAETVKKRSFIDRLLIVSIRHQIGVEAARELELEDLIRIAVEEGWLSRHSIEQLEIGAITIDGDSASGAALTRAMIESSSGPGMLEELTYDFVREGGEWKFRFGSLVRGLNRVIEDFSAQLGTEEDDLIFVLVENLSGRSVLPEIWDTPEFGQE